MIVHAHDPLCLGLGFDQSGQEQRCQDGDDRDDDQEFDQREAKPSHQVFP